MKKYPKELKAVDFLEMVAWAAQLVVQKFLNLIRNNKSIGRFRQMAMTCILEGNWLQCLTFELG